MLQRHSHRCSTLHGERQKQSNHLAAHQRQSRRVRNDSRSSCSHGPSAFSASPSSSSLHPLPVHHLLPLLQRLPDHLPGHVWPVARRLGPHVHPHGHRRRAGRRHLPRLGRLARRPPPRAVGVEGGISASAAGLPRRPSLRALRVLAGRPRRCRGSRWALAST